METQDEKPKLNKKMCKLIACFELLHMDIIKAGADLKNALSFGGLSKETRARLFAVIARCENRLHNLGAMTKNHTEYYKGAITDTAPPCDESEKKYFDDNTQNLFDEL